MNPNIHLEDMIDIIQEQLKSGGVFTFCPSGSSMEPFLKQGDRVTIQKSLRYQKYDIVLFRLKDGSFVLHRIIAVNTNGTYDIRGDNQFYIEREVEPEAIVGKVISYTHRGNEKTKTHSLGVQIWNKMIVLRKIRRMLKQQ